MDRIEDVGKKALNLYKSLTPEPALADESGVIKRLNQDWVAFSLKYYPYKLFKILSEIAGKEVAADCMYRFGYSCGKEIGERYVVLGKSGEDAATFTAAGSTYFGWGVVEIVELTREKGIVRVYNSFEARSCIVNNRERASKPVCNFFRGVIASIFEVSYNEEAEARETRCCAMGDEYCEFEVVPKY